MSGQFIASSDIPLLLKRWNQKVNEQSFKAMEAVDGGHIEIIDRDQVRGTVNMRAGGAAGAGWIQDKSAITYGGKDPTQAYYDPCVLFAGFEIGRLAANQTKNVKDGVDLVRDSIDALIGEIQQVLARSIFSSLNSPIRTTTTANSSTTTTLDEPGGLEVGMAMDVYNDSNAFVETVTITNIAYSSDPTADITITFTGGGTGGACANNWTKDTFNAYLHGAGPSAATTDYQMVSFEDITAAANLYGKATTQNNWSGNLDSSTTTLTREAMDALYVLIVRRRKMAPTAIFVDSVNEARYSRLEEDKVRYSAGGAGGLDSRGKGKLTFRGVPLIVDENAGQSNVWFHQKKDVKIHRFQKFSPDGSNGGKGEVQMITSENTYSYKVPYSGAFNLRVEARAGTGRMSAIAA